MPRITAIVRNGFLIGDKSIKKTLKITLIGLFGIVLLAMLGVFALRFSAVQTFLAKRVADYLSDELNTTISIDRVYFSPFSSLDLFSSLELQNLSIHDRNDAPMLHAKAITAGLSLGRIFDNRIEVRRLKLQDAFVHYQIDSAGGNFGFLADYFAPAKEKTDRSSRMEWNLRRIELLDCTFKLNNHRNRGKKNAASVDFSDLELTAISGLLSAIRFSGTDFSAEIKELTFRDKSGFLLEELTTSAYVSDRKMEFKDLALKTNRSRIGDHLLFEYADFRDFRDFRDFVRKVNVRSTLRDSYVDSRDIEFFAPTMQRVRFGASVWQASLSGTVEHIRAEQTHIRTGENTWLKGNFTIDGLPYIEKTEFRFDLAELATDAKDLEQIVPPLANLRTLALPDIVQRIKTLRYEGALTGFYHHFKVDGQARTSAGTLRTQTEINLKPFLRYKGEVAGKNIDLGTLLDARSFGKTGLEGRFEGSGTKEQDLKLAVDGTFNGLFFKGYRYDRLTVSGEMADGLLSAGANVRDPHATLSLEIQMNRRAEAPTYAFRSTIDLLDLKRTRLHDRDSIVLRNSRPQARLAGGSLNSLTGKIWSERMEFSSSRGDFAIGRVDVEASGTGKSKRLALLSEVADVAVSGEIDLKTLIPYFKSLAVRYAPSIQLEPAPYSPQNFNLEMLIKSFGPVSALFDPHLKLDDGARLTAQFSTEDHTAKFDATGLTAHYRGAKLTNLSICEDALGSGLMLAVSADRISFSDSVYIDNVQINSLLANDILRFNVLMSDRNRPNYLDLSGAVRFAQNEPARVRFGASALVLNGEVWHIDQDADLHISKGRFHIGNLLLKRDRQEVSVNGQLSGGEDDRLEVAFREFNLASFSGITDPLGIHVRGSMSGDVRVGSVFKSPGLSAHIRTTPLVYNNLPVGSLTVDADFEPQNGRIRLQTALRNVDGNGFDLSGTYDLNAKPDALRLKGTVRNTDLAVVQPFVQQIASDLYGKVSGEVDIAGTLQRPVVSGLAQVRDAGFTVDYLRTAYRMPNGFARIDNNSILLADFDIRDGQSGTARANGYLDLNTMSDPKLEFHVSATKLHVLHTRPGDNELFHGTAYASGNFNFKGRTSAIDIDIEARSEPNTVITIPFNSAAKVGDSDFIHFVDRRTAAGTEKTPSGPVLRGLTMNMDLSIAPDAEIRLANNVGLSTVFGTGAMSLRISSLGDFEIFGDYHVSSGRFHFTAQDFLNKFFDLKPGGSIRWAGNPAEATIDLSAAYRQRTSVAPLYSAAGQAENRESALVEADMVLRGTLSQPEVSFALDFPQHPYIKDELQGYLSDANNVNQQAISLIVRRSFIPGSMPEFGSEMRSTLLSAGSEIMFNQLNSIISRSLNVDFFDLNIRSLNDASASLRFFNDRLVFTGGITDNRNQQLTDLTLLTDKIATDAELTFKLRRDGNLLLRSYNRPNPRNFLFTPTGDYISALGLVYRREFDSLGGFWRRLWKAKAVDK